MNFSKLFLILTAWHVGGSTALDAQQSGFGAKEKSGAALIGILYDFKLDQKRQKTNVGGEQYFDIVDAFMAQGWDEGVLNKYFRATQPLYATQIFIPNLSAESAPMAFGVSHLVKPKLWMVHYKGQVSPPSSGRYRFAGAGDDVIAVAVNGQPVLVERYKGHFTRTIWRSSDKRGPAAGNTKIVYGDWFEAREGEVLDLDILLGERPGGTFCAFLQIQKEGQTYQMSEGSPILPIFRVSKDEPVIPPPSGRGGGPPPPVAIGMPPWKAVQ